MEATKMSLKLLIDTKANKVLFAEAGKDFVDFLFNLLSLPVGAVVKLLTGRSKVGCIGSIYSSFADMGEAYMQPNLCKDILLNPSSATAVTNFPILKNSSESTTTKRTLYTCPDDHGHLGIKYGAECRNCYGSYNMTKVVGYVYDSASQANDNNAPNGFVQGIVTYMVSDDLSITPMSMISSISMIKKYTISQINVLEEKMVEFGVDEALELLMASLQSEATLSAVFLRKKEVEMNFDHKISEASLSISE